MKNNKITGYATALFTVAVWGTTFISTKVLLVELSTIEILFIRFLMGLIALSLACPKRLRGVTPKQEITFAAAGLTGVCLYCLLEAIALSYTLAANVSVLVSVAPIFTAILSRIFLKEEGARGKGFVVGFCLAILGISLISFNGVQMSLNPLGDCLALLAALCWATYSVLMRKINNFGYSVILTTRRTFIYGLIFMLPVLWIMDIQWKWAVLFTPAYGLNLLFLGLCASALCFVTWNFSVKVLGAVKTSACLYLVPPITAVTSTLILHEKITGISVAGTILILIGLAFSQHKKKEG